MHRPILIPLPRPLTQTRAKLTTQRNNQKSLYTESTDGAGPSREKATEVFLSVNTLSACGKEVGIGGYKGRTGLWVFSGWVSRCSPTQKLVEGSASSSLHPRPQLTTPPSPPNPGQATDPRGALYRLVCNLGPMSFV